MESKKKQLVAVIPHTCEGVDVSDTTAGQADVRSGKYFYSALGDRVEGQIADYSGSTAVTPTEQAQTVGTGGKYVGSDITVAAIPSEYKDTTGTDAVAGDMLAGKKAVTGAGLVTGNVQTYAGASTVTQNGTLATAGKYVESDIEVNVPSGGGAVSENDVTFYDYDGTVVASYTAEDFANLTAMPDNPTHAGLVAEGWNWELAAAKTYVASYKYLNIGQHYHTESGKNEFDVEANEGNGMRVFLGINGTTDWGDGVIDNNVQHTYTVAGNYTIYADGNKNNQDDDRIPAIYSSNIKNVRLKSGFQLYRINFLQNQTGVRTLATPLSVGSFVITQWRQIKFLSIGSGSNFRSYNDTIENVSLPYSVYENIKIPPSVRRFTPRYANQDSATSPHLRCLETVSSVLVCGNDYFHDAYKLKNISLRCSSIGSNAFYNCKSLSKITIPASVTSIGVNAFQGCECLYSITVLATTPPTLSNSNAFPSNVTKIYIPNGTLAAYQTATNWSAYTGKFVELPA